MADASYHDDAFDPLDAARRIVRDAAVGDTDTKPIVKPETLLEVFDFTSEVLTLGRHILRYPEQYLERAPGATGIETYEEAIAVLRGLARVPIAKIEGTGTYTENGRIGALLMAAWRIAMNRAEELAPNHKQYDRDTNAAIRLKPMDGVTREVRRK